MEQKSLFDTVQEILAAQPEVEPTEPLDDVLYFSPYMIKAEDFWIAAEQKLWQSWTGRRTLMGFEYHGPVFLIDAKPDATPFAGARECVCNTCQSTVAPQNRVN